MSRYAVYAALVICGPLAACTPLAASRQHGDASAPPQTNPVEDAGAFADEASVAGADGASAIDTGLGTPCIGEGVERCSPAGAGARQVCTAGVWAATAACASGQICQDAEGAVSCQTITEVCKGSAGMSVCDNQSSLIVCNADGTVKNQQQCASLRLCLLGQTTGKCAICEPDTEFRCTGAALEVCAPDGQSFILHETCATESLCNKVAGTCTTGVCAPNKVTCSANMLTKCNADGSAFASQMPCGMGTCDEVGADCNACEPGHKRCEGDMVLTCEPTGQDYVPSACPAGGHCVGAGNCAACSMNSHCSSMTQGCKVGVCGDNNVCSAQNAAAGTSCTTTSNRPGTCSNGSCVCTPQCSGKQCGDDGCGGQCPSQCSFLQTCSMNRCVDCTSNSDCSGSLDGCRTGMCANGVCSQVNAPSTKACSGSGTCLNGSCCVPSCRSNYCGSNGCGGTCRCAAGSECRSEQCVPALGTACSTPQTNSSECGSTISEPRTCFRLSNRPSFCVRSSTPCPSGTEFFGGGALGACLYRCVAGGSIFGCPSPLTVCTEVYPGMEGTPAYCTR